MGLPPRLAGNELATERAMAFLRDGPRQSALTAAGWVVVRTHWYEVREESDRFLCTLASRS